VSDKKNDIVIIDDQPLFREIPLIRYTWSDLAIVNTTLERSNGLTLINNIKAFSIGVPFLVLSPHDDSLYAERALRAGANGYITKHQPASEFLFAMRRVLAGEVYLSENL
jgi:DNA-binding NarL/FixJ family response regulator